MAAIPHQRGCSAAWVIASARELRIRSKPHTAKPPVIAGAFALRRLNLPLA